LNFSRKNIDIALGGENMIKTTPMLKDELEVKFEVDKNPPDYAAFEIKYRLLPIPYEITLYDMPSLFAGKIHAVNLKHLTARLAQSGYIPEGKQITIEDLEEMLRKRFSNIDFVQVKQDVLPFIKNPGALDVWNTDFFCEIIKSLKADT